MNKTGNQVISVDYGTEIHKQARQKAKEKQMVINNLKNNKRLKAHLAVQRFYIPQTQQNIREDHIEMTE
eukprot:11138327-Heterocapsa_arctica.AAC.1